jgi:undecaprenyl-diphosphatase
VHDYLISLLLGIIEGVTEFLPISSTAHLRIAEKLLSIPLDSEYWKTYTIVIQLGAILSLPVYFRHRIAAFIRTFPKGARGDRTILTHPLSLTLIATVATAIPALALKSFVTANLENLTVIGLALLVGGIIMWIVDAMHARWEGAGADAPGSPIRTRQMDDMTLGQAIWIGLCQSLAAVFPGASRSMSTIAAGQLAGMSRAAALEFSFFLSMPTMALATANELREWLMPEPVVTDGGSTATMTAQAISVSSHDVVVLAIGFVVSFIVAYGSVAWLMNWVRRHGFVPFAIYRIALGASVLWWMR